MVAVPTAGWPQRCLGGQDLRQPLNIGHLAQSRHRFQRGQSGLVRQQLPDGDLTLAVLREVGPVVGHGAVEVDQTLGRGHRDGKCGNAFRRREHVDDGVSLPGCLGQTVAVTTPQVHHLDAVPVYRDGCADLSALREVGPKRVGDRSIPFVDVAADQGRRNRHLEHHESASGNDQAHCGTTSAASRSICWRSSPALRPTGLSTTNSAPASPTRRTASATRSRVPQIAMSSLDSRLP